MFTILELVQILITILALSYIFQDLFLKEEKIFNKEALLYSSVLSTLSVISHEMAHKFTAISLGFKATYHASLIGLSLGIILRTFHLPIFFIPAYVSIPANAPALSNALIGISGPLSNLSLFLVVHLIRRFKSSRFLEVIGKINLLLFLFNMIPFPGTDGYHFFSSLIRMI